MTATAMSDVRNPAEFRRVLGHVPTGVVVVTSIGLDGEPVGMAVGSFTSVSLDPPLVGFLPARTSSTFPKIQQAGHFCVNVLSADQEDVCRSFARPGDKFAGIGWSRDGNQAPHLDGAVAWIDCTVESISDAGDHHFVLGRVHNLQVANDLLPLVFFQGGYGRFASHSIGAAPEPDLVSHLRLVDHARPIMERAARQSGIECLATAAVGTELVVLAGTATRTDGAHPPGSGNECRSSLRWARHSSPGRTPQPPPGYNVRRNSAQTPRPWKTNEPDSPAFAPVDGRSVLAAPHTAPWNTHSANFLCVPHSRSAGPSNTSWLTAWGTSRAGRPAGQQPVPVRNLGVPVFDPGGNVALMLTFYGFPRSSARSDIDHYVNILQAASTEITAALGANHDRRQ